MKEYKMAARNQDKMKKMKKGGRCTTGFFRLILTAAALMTLCTVLFACTEEKKELSVDELVSGVLEKVAFEDEPVSYTHLDVYKRQSMRWLYRHSMIPTCHWKPFAATCLNM